MYILCSRHYLVADFQCKQTHTRPPSWNFNLMEEVDFNQRIIQVYKFHESKNVVKEMCKVL